MVRVLHFVGKMNRAGQETFIMNVYRNIDRKKISFDFLCTNCSKGDYDDEIMKLGGKFHYVALNQVTGRKRHIDNWIILYKKLSYLKDEYNVFHIHTYHAFDGLLAASAAKKAGFDQVIVHSHSAYADGHFCLHKVARLFLRRMHITKLACSEKAGAWLFGDRKFEVIKNGIDVKKFLYSYEIREKVRKELKISENACILGHVGRFDPVKNHVYLINLFEKYLKVDSNAVLLLVGEGELRAECEKICEEKQISKQVIFTGMRTDTYELYQAMDVFVFPSTYEGLGIVAVEAQTSGLPCVVSDAVPREIDITPNVRHCKLENCFDEWIKEILNCYKDIKQRGGTEEMIIKAGYDIHKTVEKLESIYFRD